ncbi:MAG: ATP-binding protein [Candidatus Woesearchaeota archaeon]
MQIQEQLKKAFLGREDVLTDIIGQDSAKKELMSALLMGRHIIIFGKPGIGKTTLAKNVARLLPELELSDCDYNCLPEKPLCPRCIAGKSRTRKVPGVKRFVRVQGSPDLTAEDILGDIDPIKAMKFGPLSIEAFTPGKILKANNGILFFDELNRCPEKLQNALLQVLEEGKITIGGYDFDFPVNFLFIGTMNPQDTSTEELSEVLLDRFDVVYMSYPESDKIEIQVVKTNGKQVCEISEGMLALLVRFIRSLREDSKLELVPSVRATIGLYERSQANALLQGRKKVQFEDIKDAVISVVAHRIRLKPSAKFLDEPTSYLKKEFEDFINNNYPEAQQLEQDRGDYR